MILAVCANEKSGIFGEQNWWFNARSYGLCWSLVRSFVHTYLKLDGTPFTDDADYAVKSFRTEYLWFILALTGADSHPAPVHPFGCGQRLRGACAEGTHAHALPISF